MLFSLFLMITLPQPIQAKPSSSSPKGAPDSQAWAVWQNLDQLPRLRPGDSSALRSSYCLDGCRRDRHSQEAPKFVRTLGEEGILFEDWGPGVVTRIWMTMGSGISEPLDPSMTLRITIDGEVVTEMPLPDFFQGDNAPFLLPMNGNRDVSSGGNFCYTPIAYRNHCRISLLHARGKRIWFQLNHQRLFDQDRVEPFDGTQTFETWRQLLDQPGLNPFAGKASPLATGLANLQPGGSTNLLNLAGSDTLFAMTVQVPREFWHTLHINITADGGLRVAMPLADFFAMGRADLTRALFLGFDGTRLYCHFPMPYFHEIRVTISDPEHRLPQPLSIPFQFQSAGFPAPSDSGYFTAMRQEATVALGEAYHLFDVTGRGKWVGLFAELGSIGDPLLNYLEGDEQIFLNGASVPQFYGTGVEDFFGGGFYFRDSAMQPEPFQLALHGMVFHQEAGGESTTAMYRFMASDAVSFADGARAVLEAGPRANIAMRAKTITYFYLDQDPGMGMSPGTHLAKTSSFTQAGLKTNNTSLSIQGSAITFTDPMLEAFFLQNRWQDLQSGERHPFDSNQDGVISLAEALAVTGAVDIGHRDIGSLDELDFFTNMTSLTITGTAVLTLELHQLNQLERLFLRGNESLETVDLDGFANLKHLEILDHPGLLALNLSASPGLETLVSDTNPLLSHDFLNNQAFLQNLYVARTHQENIALTGMASLRELVIEYAPNLQFFGAENLPQLKVLQLNTCPELVALRLQNLPRLKILQSQHIPKLSSLSIQDLGQLEALRFRHMDQFHELRLKNLPRLEWLEIAHTDLMQLELDSCPALEGAQLSHNSLGYLGSLTDHSSLEWLDLRGNQLRSLPLLPTSVTNVDFFGNHLRNTAGTDLLGNLIFVELGANQLLQVDNLTENASLLNREDGYLGLAENFLSQDDCLTLNQLQERSNLSGAIFAFENQLWPVPVWPDITILELMDLRDQLFDCATE